MDCIYLSGSMARSTRRLARWGRGVLLVPTDVSRVASLSWGRVTEASLGLSKLKAALGMSPLKNVELHVPSREARIRARGVSCHVLSRKLPKGSFWRVEKMDGPLSIELPEQLEVLVESPFLSFLLAAGQLTKLVGRGAMSDEEADLRLFKLGVEECSTYALDPIDPVGGCCLFESTPLLCAQELRDYLALARGMPGLVRARRVAELVFDGSASPMETFVNAGISLPTRYGCFELQRPALNEVIPLSDVQKLILNHVDHITPDLLWKELMIIIEFLGQEPHEGKAAQDEDAGRIQDYEVLGYCVLPVRYQHVRSPDAFNKLVARLALVMQRCGVKGVCSWTEGLRNDSDFAARQRVFFALLLPAVKDWR